MKTCPTCGKHILGSASRCAIHVGSRAVEDLIDDTVRSPVGETTDVFMRTRAGTAPTEPPPIDRSETTGSSSRVLGGRYRLGARIGAGGFGAVYDAQDERLGKRVAVKTLAPALVADKDVLARFKCEAVAASQIRHECVVDVTDFDVDEDGTHFLVMELLDGQDLGMALDGRPMAPDRALSIAAQCASALASTHAAGILHRDLKPGNVFLVSSPMRSDFVKIIDFGISKIVNLRVLEGQFVDITSESEVVGTPFYMPPEQSKGLELDGRVDQYALGVILYEMLTGNRPFVGRSVFEILSNHIEQERVPPSAVQPFLRLIAGLDDLLVRAIASDRDDRFESMEAFGTAIEKCLDNVNANRLLLRAVKSGFGLSEH